jgi:hypothetical protein
VTANPSGKGSGWKGSNLIPVGETCPDPSDLNDTLSILQKGAADQNSWVSWWLPFSPEYQKAIRGAGIRLLVIDDMNHLPFYHADILLNQNIHAPDLTIVAMKIQPCFWEPPTSFAQGIPEIPGYPAPEPGSSEEHPDHPRGSAIPTMSPCR